MARVKIKFPTDNPLFICTIPVRITDINYGSHLGNDAIVSILHEARVQLLASWGYTELDAGGNSLIMADLMIAYRSESFYGDILTVKVYADEVSNRSFDLLYHVSTTRNGETLEISHAKTALVCFDYTTRKIADMMDTLKEKLIGG